MVLYERNAFLLLKLSVRITETDDKMRAFAEQVFASETKDETVRDEISMFDVAEDCPIIHHEMAHHLHTDDDEQKRWDGRFWIVMLQNHDLLPERTTTTKNHYITLLFNGGNLLSSNNTYLINFDRKIKPDFTISSSTARSAPVPWPCPRVLPRQLLL